MEFNKISIDYSGKKNRAHYFFLCSDLHMDHELHDKDLLDKDFKEAVKNNARIFINGDLLDYIMLGDSKRYVKSNDPFPKRNDALNCIIEFAVDRLKDYADYIDIIGVGNHEISVIKYNNFDPVLEIIRRLNAEHRSKTLYPIAHGGYTGFILLQFIGPAKHRARYSIWYNHGVGGSAPVTKGAIDLARRQYIDANIIWLGHKHSKIVHQMDQTYRITQSNDPRIITSDSFGIITGCYIKNISQYDIKKTGYKISFSEERMRTPQAQGGITLLINIDSNDYASGKIII